MSHGDLADRGGRMGLCHDCIGNHDAFAGAGRRPGATILIQCCYQEMSVSLFQPNAMFARPRFNNQRLLNGSLHYPFLTLTTYRRITHPLGFILFSISLEIES